MLNADRHTSESFSVSTGDASTARAAVKPALWIPWLLVVLLSGSTAWLSFHSQFSSPKQLARLRRVETAERSADADPHAVGVLHTMSQADAAVRCLELLGYENVRSYSWSGGTLEGWIEFDDRRQEIVTDGWTDDTSGFTGTVVIADSSHEPRNCRILATVKARTTLAGVPEEFETSYAWEGPRKCITETLDNGSIVNQYRRTLFEFKVVPRDTVAQNVE